MFTMITVFVEEESNLPALSGLLPTAVNEEVSVALCQAYSGTWECLLSPC